MPRLAIVLVLALTALVSGCGGADVAYTEVESAPEGLPIPDGAVSAPAAGVDEDADDRNGNVTTGRPTPTAEAVAPTDGAVAAPTAAATTAPVAPTDPVVPEDTTDDDTGAAAPPPVEEEATAVPPSDTGGAVAPGNDQFCADNPGACDN